MRTQMMVILGVTLMTGTPKLVASSLPDSCGSDKVKFSVTHHTPAVDAGMPDPGKAQVVLIESLDKAAQCIGCDITGRIGVDGAWVGANKGSSYFVFPLVPGNHNLCANWQSKIEYLKSKVAMASLNAEAGKTYYYKLNISLASYAFDLVPVSEDEAKYRMRQSSLSEFKPSH